MAIRFLLDTNIVLGLLKSTSVAQLDELRTATSDECAYSSITRVELLGFPGIGETEDIIIRNVLAHFHYLAITRDIEDIASGFRRQFKAVKLPDALIMATAHAYNLRLITLDEDLKKLRARILSADADL